MLGSIAFALAAQAQPPVAVSHSPPPPLVAVPGPPFPGHVPGAVVDATGPAPPAPVIVRAPLPRRALAGLVSVADYPASALAAGEEGAVAFVLDVGANGRVSGCTITRSSGSPALDAATCRLMRSRARFTPALDSSGMPAAGRVSDAVEWRLPPAPGERG